MKPPVIRRSRPLLPERSQEHGITMILVAVAMVAIIAMAALSIDVVTLYLAKEEAQRTADAAALAGAKVISLSGVTGAPNNPAEWLLICSGANPATQAANAVGQQSTVGSVAPTVSVTYSAGGSAPSPTCAGFPFTTGVNNPLVTVIVTRPGLPTFFSRIWGNTGNSVSATATAEVFNPSNSGNVGNGATGTIIPVQPRCVKPWIVPNRDPLHPGLSAFGYCDQGGGPCDTWVGTNDGSITHKGISLSGTGANGIIGEKFWLNPDCRRTGGTCRLRATPQANYYSAASSVSQVFIKPPPNLHYLPGEAPGAAVAVPSCSSGKPYEEAIAGCDQSTAYQCGVQHSSSANPNRVDLSENPGSGTNDTMNGVKCLIHETDETDPTPSGQDSLDLTAYPFQMLPGTNNPLAKAGLASTTPITNSISIISLPIYDSAADTITGSQPVTIVGFLQVFINSVDQYGNVNLTVLNVAGCSNGTGTDPVSTAAIKGSSPVPVRLITPP